MIRAQIRLTGEQYRRVKALTRQQNVSMAQPIRNAIDEWLDRHAELPDTEHWQRSLTAIGEYRSVLSDVAGNHDHYLAEAYGDYPPR